MYTCTLVVVAGVAARVLAACYLSIHPSMSALHRSNFQWQSLPVGGEMGER